MPQLGLSAIATDVAGHDLNLVQPFDQVAAGERRHGARLKTRQGALQHRQAVSPRGWLRGGQHHEFLVLLEHRSNWNIPSVGLTPGLQICLGFERRIAAKRNGRSILLGDDPSRGQGALREGLAARLEGDRGFVLEGP